MDRNFYGSFKQFGDRSAHGTRQQAVLSSLPMREHAAQDRQPGSRGTWPYDPAMGGAGRLVAPRSRGRDERRRSGALPDGEPAEPFRPDRPHGARRTYRHGARRAGPAVAAHYHDEAGERSLEQGGDSED